MSEFSIGQNDRLPSLRTNLQTEDGYVDLTGGTGYFIFKNKYATDQPVTGNVDIIGATSGYVQYQWTSGNVELPAVFYGRWVAILDGKNISFPNDGYLPFFIQNALFSL